MASIKIDSAFSHVGVTAPNTVNDFSTPSGGDGRFDACWDGSSLNDRIVIGSAGHYLCGAQITQEQLGSDLSATFDLLLNGSTVASGAYGQDVMYEADLSPGDILKIKMTFGTQNYFALWATTIDNPLSTIQADPTLFETFNNADGAVSSGFTVLSPTHASGATLVTDASGALSVPSDGSVYLVQATATLDQSEGSEIRIACGSYVIASPGPPAGPTVVSDMCGTFVGHADPGTMTLQICSIFVADEGDGVTLGDAFSLLGGSGSGLPTSFHITGLTVTKLSGAGCSGGGGGGGGTVIKLTSTGAVDHIGVAHTLASSFAYAGPEILETDPSTGLPWTLDGVNSTLYGAKFD